VIDKEFPQLHCGAAAGAIPAVFFVFPRLSHRIKIHVDSGFLVLHRRRLGENGFVSAHAPHLCFFFLAWKFVVLLTYLLFFAKSGIGTKLSRKLAKWRYHTLAAADRHAQA
jgi:hypothetical protein